MPPRIQCLLFVRPQTELETTHNSISSNSDTPKGYAFLPLEFIYHPACSLLSQNGIQVVTDKQILRVNNSSFDVIETLLEYVKVGTTPNSVRILVDLSNLESVERLITVSRQQFDLVTNFRRTENIRSAVVEKNLKTMENFLSADLRYCSDLGGTLLHFAAEKGYVSLVKLLIKHRADVNSVGPTGCTPLHIAASRYAWYPLNFEIAELLIKAGANLESRLTRYSNYATPLHSAVFWNVFEVAHLLAENGADLEARTTTGLSCLHIAAERGLDKLIDFFVQKGAIVDSAINSENAMEGATPLLIAVKQKQCAAAKRLLESGANVNAVCFNGNSVLYYAVHTATLEIVESVLGYCPDVKDAANKRAFELAFRKNAQSSRVIAEKLVEYGFEVGPEDVNSTDFLFGAIQKDILPVVQKLVSLGANINQPFNFVNRGKMPPIHLAAQCASEEVVRVLLDHGADIESKRVYRSQTPLFEAVAFSNLNVAKLLLARNAKVKRQNLLHTAVRTKCLPMVELLLKSGIDVNITTYHEPCPPLGVALSESQACIIDELMKFGARFDFSFVSSIEDNPHNLHAFLNYGFTILDPGAKTRITTVLSNLANFTRNTYATPRILASHVVKVEVAYGTMNDREIIPENVYNLFELDAFKRQCQEEIALMKVERLGWTNVTFYDVLTNGTKGFVRCLEKRKSIERSLKSYEKYAEERYPIYASIILCHFRQGLLRKKLVATGYEVLNVLFNHFSALPHDLKDIIVNYLNNQDILMSCLAQ